MKSGFFWLVLLVFLLGCSTPTQVPTGTSAPDPTPTLTPAASPTSTQACETYTADLVVDASAQQVRVGETVEITGTLTNTGCLALGLPQYRLANPQRETSPFTPFPPEPTLHSLGVAPGGSDQVVFSLQAVASGATTLVLSASFEVHQGYPGPAFWGQASSEALQIEVLP